MLAMQPPIPAAVAEYSRVAHSCMFSRSVDPGALYCCWLLPPDTDTMPSIGSQGRYMLIAVYQQQPVTEQTELIGDFVLRAYIIQCTVCEP